MMVITKCDICGKEYHSRHIDDLFEIQEMLQIRHHCGYSSIFGDLNQLDIDICQHCFKSMLDTTSIDLKQLIYTTNEYFIEENEKQEK